MTIVATDVYVQRSNELLTPEEREGLRDFLAKNPESGDVIPGLAGLRKLRWTQQSRNKGKRGGTRIVYFYTVSHQVLVLLSIYSKGEQEDLTNADRKNLKEAIAKLKADIASRPWTDQRARK